MENNVCKICGGSISRQGNSYVCKYCGNKWVIDADQDIHVIDRANAWSALRDCDFEKATELFENIILKEPDNHEAYWGRALSRAGIIYVTDLNENKKVPTCNNISEESFVDDSDVVKAISLAPDDIADSYAAQSKQIESIRAEWLKKASKEPPYDVFISFKDSDRAHDIERTQDSVDAQDLYNALVAEGYKVFFSRISLRDKISEQYEPYIYNAIKTAKVMIVFGEKPEYFSSVWIKNEWSRFALRIENGDKHKSSLVVVYKNMDPALLPASLKSRQCMNANDLTFLSDLNRHIKKIIDLAAQSQHLDRIEIKGGQIAKKATTISQNTISTREIGQGKVETSIDEKQLLNLVPTYIEAKQWEDAASLIDNILFENPSCAEAMWLKLHVKHRVRLNALYPKLSELTPDDLILIEKLLESASKDYAAGILDYLYAAGAKIDEATYARILDIILPYSYAKRDEQIEYVASVCIDNHSFFLFKKLLSALDSNDVDRYIRFNEEYMRAAKSNIEKRACAENILSVDEGNLVAIKLIFFLDLKGGANVEVLGKSFEQILKFSPDADECVLNALDWLNDNLSTATHCEFAKQLLRYYTAEMKQIHEKINNLAYFMVKNGFFEESKYFFRLILSSDEKYADAYWGICLANIEAKSDSDVVHAKTPIKKQLEFNKYLTFVDQKRRLECLKLATKQENAIKNSKRTKIFAISAASVIALVVAVSLLINYVIIPSTEYSNAVKLMQSGKYDEAIDAFEALNGYKDSNEQIDACNTAILQGKYDAAAKLMSEGKYAEAIDAFKALDGFSDSAAQIDNCNTAILQGKYDAAAKLMSEGKYAEAIDAFKALDGFSDSVAQIDACNTAILQGKYDAAAKLMSEGKYTEAIDAFKALDGFSDSAAQIDNCKNAIDKRLNDAITEAKALAAEGKYTEACNALNSVGCTDKEFSLYTAYKEMSLGNYKAAIDAGLTEITIPEGITEIAESAFEDCVDLISVTIPDSVTKIGVSAFEGCKNLQNIIIGDGVTYLSAYAFYDCDSLETIALPESLTNIEKGVFASCESLETIYYNGSYNEFAAIINENSQTILSKQLFIKCSCGEYTSTAITQGNFVDATCIEKGSYDELIICSSCNAEIYKNTISVDCIEHTPTEAVQENIIDKTCTEDGSYDSVTYCSACNEELSRESMKIICTGHTSAEAVKENIVDATCTEDGSYDSVVYCSVCQGEVSRTSVTIQKTGNHSYNSENTCTVCQKYKDTGVKFSLSNNQYSITDYTGTATEVVIPSTYKGIPVTSIGDDAFYYCSSLTSITIPDSVTSIGSYAFYNCTSLTSIVFSENSQLTSIGSYAFCKCSSLTSVTIPDSVTSIGENAFFGCSSLTSITIPNSVTSLGSSAFEGCASLENATIPASAISYIPKSSLKTVIITSGESIGAEAFWDCSSLTSVTIPDSVTSIGEDAFYNCSSLTKVHISDISAWCNIYFDGYSANPLYYAENLYLNGELVTDLVIPDSVTSIGYYAFYGCSSLTSITIPDSVRSIGDGAFSRCSSLTSVTIPDSVTSIGYAAFYDCSSLTKVHISDISAWCNISFGGNYANPLYYAHNLYLNGELVTDLVIPDSVTSIGSYAFYNCTSLTSIVFSENSQLTSIGSYAFCKCSSLESITIPDSVKSIGHSAFIYCLSLESITIPDSVTSIGEHAFYYCSSLTSITILNSVTSIGEWAFYNCSSLESITIPDSVTSIGENAFFGCSSLASITIPNSVTSIGENAFLGCSSLTSITIPNSVTSIGEDVFYKCSSLTSITIPDSVTSIDSSAFSGCSNLESITVDKNNSVYHSAGNCLIETESKTLITGCKNSVIPTDGSVTSIGYSAFSGCSSLTIITIPDSVTSIGRSAFYGCSSLTSITIPDSVISLGSSAFYGCSSLTSITILNSVTSIGEWAFYNCSSLESITIPDSVTSISDYAFLNCSSLETVYYTGTEEEWAKISIGSSNSYLTNATIIYNYKPE